MDVKTLIWTLILFGGTIAVVLSLVAIAWRHESSGEHGNKDDAEPADSASHQ